VQVLSDGGPGAVSLDGLPPATALEVVVETVRRRGGGGRVLARLPFATVAPPPGDLRFRFATISDLHIGQDGFGAFFKMREEGVSELHPVRCARAAIAEALAWGAQLLVVKGDMAHEGEPQHWEAAAGLLATVPVPVEAVPGNHDVGRDRTIDPQPALDEHGIRVTHGLHVRDVPGLRLVLFDTTVPGRNYGRARHLQDDLARVLRRAPGGAFVAMHHFPQRYRFPTAWPPGIAAPQSLRFLDAVAAANPATLLSSGHTHRNRLRRHGPLHVGQVGSTKDHPGVWAGYAVHDGGIRQVVRRVADPSCIRWTERTRRALGGLWGVLAPGTLEDRCFSITWPPRT
jgi:predicted phosphodiesterase